MKRAIIGAAIGTFLAMPVLAQDAGDAAAGEKEFRKCRACHMIQAPDGTDIVKGGQVGPNLYGVVGRAAGSQEGYKYSDALMALNATGEVWNKVDLASYVTDPNAFVQEKTGDSSARTKMSFKLAKGQADVVAYLVSVAPDAASPAGDAAPATN